MNAQYLMLIEQLVREGRPEGRSTHRRQDGRRGRRRSRGRRRRAARRGLRLATLERVPEARDLVFEPADPAVEVGVLGSRLLQELGLRPLRAEQLHVPFPPLTGPVGMPLGILASVKRESASSTSSWSKWCSRSVRCRSSATVCGPRSISRARSESSASSSVSASSSRCRYLTARLPAPLASRTQPRRESASSAMRIVGSS